MAIILAEILTIVDGAGTFSAMDFWELGRVEASHWTWSFLPMFTFIFRHKQLRFYCEFCHTKALKNFRQDFYLVPKWRTWIFHNFGQVRDPISDFFILFRKFLKLIFWVKRSSKSHEKPLGPFRCKCFIRYIRRFWIKVAQD